MKNKISLKFVGSLVILLILFPTFPSYASNTRSNHLELVGISGISDTPGTFSRAYTPSFWVRNFFKQGMDVDEEGNIYLGDSGESQIEVFSNDLTPLRHFGSIGSGPGQFQHLIDLKISNELLFALDYSLASIKVFELDGTFLYEFSTQVPQDKFTSYPSGLAISRHQHIFVMDLRNGLKKFDIEGNFIKHKSIFNNLIPDPSMFIGMQDLKTDSMGNLYLLFNFGQDGSPAIIIIDPQGNLLIDFQNNCYLPIGSHYFEPNGCFAIENNTFYGILWDSFDFSPDYFQMFSYTFSLDPCDASLIDDHQVIFSKKEEKPCPVDIYNPTAFLAKNSELILLDSWSNTLYKFSNQGELLQSYQSPRRPFGTLSDISYRQDGHIFISDFSQSKVHVYTNDLEYVKSIGEPANQQHAPTPGALHRPGGLAIDWRNYLYVADSSLNCIQVFDENGKGIATIIPEGVIGKIHHLAISYKGNLLVSSVFYESLSNRIMITEIDIQQVDLEVHKQVKSTHLPVRPHPYHPMYFSECGLGPFVPSMKGGFILPCYFCADASSEHYTTLICQVFDADGKMTQILSDENHRKARLDQRVRLHAISYGYDHSLLLADSESGVWWKFDDQYNLLWEESTQWHGLHAICTDDEGYIYAIDQIHGVVLKYKDHSFQKPAPKDPLSIEMKPYHKTTLQSVVNLSGTVAEGSQVLLNGKPVFVNRIGTFYATIYPEVGDNQWNLLARHPIKGEIEKQIQVYRKEKTLIRMNIGSTAVYIDDKEHQLEATVFIDAASNRSFCPIRIVVEAIGGMVGWVGSEQKVLISIPGIEMALIVDSPYAYVNSEKISIDPINEEQNSIKVAPKLINGRVFLPLRFVSEQLKFRVEWIAEKQEIRLHYPDK